METTAELYIMINKTLEMKAAAILTTQEPGDYTLSVPDIPDTPVI